MSKPDPEPLRTPSRWAIWRWALGVFLLGLGARLWLIHRFGTPLPFWDQWENARVVFFPFFEGKLTWGALFSPHNEHRILFTRLYGLALLLLNGEWDGQMQMVLNGVIHCATLTGVGWLMARLIRERYWALIWLPLALVLALPFGWENSLAGFQSQFYFLLLFSLLTLWLLGLHRPNTAAWWCGVATAVMAQFTVASGFLAAAAVFALAVFRALRRPARRKLELPTLAVCTVVVIAGLLLKADVQHHIPLQAHSVGDFVKAFAENLAWPWIVLPPFALLNLAPLCLLALCYFRSDDDQPAEEMTLAIGAWTILQGAAAAYARGANGKLPGWRYMDSSSFIFLASCFSIAILLSRYSSLRAARASGEERRAAHLREGEKTPSQPTPTPPAGVRQSGGKLRSSLFAHVSRPGAFAGAAMPLWYCLFAFWAICCAAGLGLLTLRAWRIDIPERELYYRAQLRSTRAFIATDDIHVFDRLPKSALPYFQGNPLAPRPNYEAELIVEYLRNPLIRSILPAPARPPLRVMENQSATHGFVRDGFRLARREPAAELSWGSWTGPGAVNTGVFESAPVARSRLPYLEISVAGDLGTNNLSLELVNLKTGEHTPVRPSVRPGDKWVSCYAHAPTGDFKIVARDASRTTWFAFKPPREMGRLSYWAIQALASWKYLLLAGAALLLFNLATLLVCARARLVCFVAFLVTIV